MLLLKSQKAVVLDHMLELPKSICDHDFIFLGKGRSTVKLILLYFLYKMAASKNFDYNLKSGIIHKEAVLYNAGCVTNGED